MEYNNNCASNHSNCSSGCTSCSKNFNPLLLGIDVKERETLDENRVQSIYKKGEMIFKENTFPSGLFCLNSGKIMITTSDNDGNRIVINLKKGVNFIGISDLLSGLPYRSSCIALTECHICMIKADVVEEMISNNSNFSRKLLTNIASDYHKSTKRLLDLTKQNMNVRIAKTLLELESEFGIDENNNIDIYLKRSEIAQICNMNETNVIRQLSLLDKSKAIKLNGKLIQILDKKYLLNECR